MHGQFVWYELTTPDVTGATKFYPLLTGWGTQPFDDDYTMWTQGGVPLAGIFNLGPELRERGVPPNWMPYVEVNDVDETAKLATSLGGAVVHGPAEIPGTGRFAVLQDPQTAVFGIYKSQAPSQAWDGTAVLGRFSWHELMTTDYRKAFDFYRRLFGWDKAGEMDMGGGNMYLLYGNGRKMFGGIFNRPPDAAGMHPFWLCYILVKDVPKAVAVATKAGGQLLRGPMDVPDGVIAILGDPQGAGFAVHHITAPVAAPRPARSKAASAPAASKARANGKAKARAKMKTRAKARSKAKARPARRAPAKASARKRGVAARRSGSKPSRGRAAKRRTRGRR
jgi:predicted enzyme related to lactoylglutathione lyase